MDQTHWFRFAKSDLTVRLRASSDQDHTLPIISLFVNYLFANRLSANAAAARA
jgi:hypothetical protein